MPFTHWLRPRATHNTNKIKPFSVPPSQAWDGDDGAWSTFTIAVGTPPQSFRVLPATNGDEIWVPVPSGCTDASVQNPPSNCGDLRGANVFQKNPSQGFNTDASSSWQTEGNYSLMMEDYLGINSDGEYGLDTVALGDSPNILSLPQQIIAGIATSEFWLGSLGLGPRSRNFSTSPVPSLMTSLVSKNLIPSLSYGYTAGAKYNTSSAAFGSLTLGGYDKARHILNDVTFDLDANDLLTVGLQTITATNTLNGTVSIISPPGIYSIINSGIPDIWLPKDACDIVEESFGLHYEDTTGRYLIDDTTRKTMDTLNPTVTFNLGPLADIYDNQTKTPQGASVAISLPYAAFVLQASYPLYPNATNYFPIRRAANETQYTIGRAFLAEAYITVDYDRSKFHVSQAISSSSGAQDLIAISSTSPLTDSPTHAPKTLTHGSIIALTITLAALLSLLCALTYIYIRRRRRRRHIHPSQISKPTTTQIPCPTHPNGELADLSNYLTPTASDAAEWEHILAKAKDPKHPAFTSTSTDTQGFVFPFSPGKKRGGEIELPTPLPPARHQELAGSAPAMELEGKRRAVYELPAEEEWVAELANGTPRGSVMLVGGKGRGSKGIRRKERPRRNLVLQIP